jgi:DNA-binding transcriptional ArsR family regulator
MSSLTKRQREILERLERGRSVRHIAHDTGVTEAAVYQTIERLRRLGALPADYTPSGQPRRSAAAPAWTGPTGSRLSELRALDDRGKESAYAELISSAIADHDVPALAYELGRADVEDSEEFSARAVEAALDQLGLIGEGSSRRSGFEGA